jgi:DNA-binding transcriptional LysR family regulator
MAAAAAVATPARCVRAPGPWRPTKLRLLVATQRSPGGMSSSLTPRSLLETTGEIAFVPIRDHPPEFRTTIAIPANRRLSAATRAMLETIRRHTGE